RDVARGHHHVARLDRREDAVQVAEEIQLAQALEPAARRGEGLALRARVAVLHVQQTQAPAPGKREESVQARRFLPLHVAAALRLEAPPRDRDRARPGPPQALTVRGGARGVRGEDRARLAVE